METKSSIQTWRSVDTSNEPNCAWSLISCTHLPIEEQQVPETSCGFFTINMWEVILKPPEFLTTSTDTQECSTRCYKYGNVLCSTYSDYYWYLPLAPQLKSAINQPPPYTNCKQKLQQKLQRSAEGYLVPSEAHYVFLITSLISFVVITAGNPWHQQPT